MRFRAPAGRRRRPPCRTCQELRKVGGVARGAVRCDTQCPATFTRGSYSWVAGCPAAGPRSPSAHRPAGRPGGQLGSRTRWSTASAVKLSSSAFRQAATSSQVESVSRRSAAAGRAASTPRSRLRGIVLRPVDEDLAGAHLLGHLRHDELGIRAGQRRGELLGVVARTLRGVGSSGTSSCIPWDRSSSGMPPARSAASSRGAARPPRSTRRSSPRNRDRGRKRAGRVERRRPAAFRTRPTWATCSSSAASWSAHKRVVAGRRRA